MKNAFEKNKWLWLGTILLSVVAAILQVLAVLFAYDSNAHYFEEQSLLPVLALVCALLGAVIGTVAAFRTDLTEIESDPFGQYVSFSPAAIGFVISAVLIATVATTVVASPIRIAVIVLSVLSCLYAVLIGFPKLRRFRNLLSLLGFTPVLACITLIAYYYFDSTFEMNAPIKTATQMALLCAMLLFVGEIRFLLGQPQPRCFLTLASWVISIGSLSAFSVPVAYLTGKLDRADYAAGGFLVFCLLLHALIRSVFLLYSQYRRSDRIRLHPSHQDTDE